MSISREKDARLMAWVAMHCPNFEQAPPKTLDNWKVMEVLWELVDVFRPNYKTFRSLPYDPAYEAAADQAIDAFLAHGKWGLVSLETLRVLLERHSQSIAVIATNEAAGNKVLSVPLGMPDDALLGFFMIFFMYEMKLPLPVQDRSSHDLESKP